MSVSAAATVEARVVPGPTRSANALMLKVNVEDPGATADVISNVADAFKREHGRPGADIRVLVVTLVGAIGAAAFASGWQVLERGDPALGRITRALAMAEVTRGAPSGQVLERVSLHAV